MDGRSISRDLMQHISDQDAGGGEHHAAQVQHRLGQAVSARRQARAAARAADGDAAGEHEQATVRTQGNKVTMTIGASAPPMRRAVLAKHGRSRSKSSRSRTQSRAEGKLMDTSAAVMVAAVFASTGRDDRRRDRRAGRACWPTPCPTSSCATRPSSCATAATGSARSGGRGRTEREREREREDEAGERCAHLSCVRARV